MNNRLRKDFNLTGYSTISHCDSKDDDYSYGNKISFLNLAIVLIDMSFYFRLAG